MGDGEGLWTHSPGKQQKFLEIHAEGEPLSISTASQSDRFLVLARCPRWQSILCVAEGGIASFEVGHAGPNDPPR